MPLYLAIDAGGTSTRCLLADATRVLARASAGTVKLQRVSEEEATARLTAMLHEVAATAGVSLRDTTAACFGLAGLSSPVVRDWADTVLADLVSGDLILCGDEEIALDAAFPGGSGILLIAGTGSNAIGRAPSGQLYGAGGWGPVLGDEGSGYWIGLEALRAALHAHDHEPDGLGQGTSLLREIESHWGLTSLGELVALANLRASSAISTPPDFAALAPVVASCAEQGDTLAAGILNHAGEELAALVTLIAHKMKFNVAPNPSAAPRASNLEPPTTNLEVAFTGSVLTHIAPVRTAMVARLAHSLPTARVRDTPVDPLDGALYRARRTS